MNCKYLHLMEVSDQLHVPTALLPEKEQAHCPQYLMERRQGGPQSHGHDGNGKNLPLQ